MTPFLTGTRIQYAWDSTSLGWLKTCPRYYYYSMIEGWRSRNESPHLKFGVHYHQALERFDRLRAYGLSHDDALRSAVRKVLEDTWEPASEGYPHGRAWDSDHNLKNRPNLVRSVVWYIEKFREDPINDPKHTVILEDGKPAIELSFRFGITDNLVICGHLDRVANVFDAQYIVDKKTTSTTISSNTFEQYSPDNQMSLYTYAGRVIYKAPIQGVIIDAAQIAVGFTRFDRGFTYRTNEQLEEWLDDTKYYAGVAQELAKRADLQGSDPIKAYPMNDKACNNYGGCVFREVCSKSPVVRDTYLRSAFKVQPWNPLEVR